MSHLDIERQNDEHDLFFNTPGDPTMITDTEARRISSEWHGGGGTALYALSSTGAINTARPDHDLLTEITDCIFGCNDQEQRDEIYELEEYVKSTGPRGPVDGWSTLTW